MLATNGQWRPWTQQEVMMRMAEAWDEEISVALQEEAHLEAWEDHAMHGGVFYSLRRTGGSSSAVPQPLKRSWG